MGHRVATPGETYATTPTWLRHVSCAAWSHPRKLTLLGIVSRQSLHCGSAADFRRGKLQRAWEALDLAKKLLLSSAVLFVPQGSVERIGIALLISATFQVLQARFQPYNSRHKNLMADAAGAALSLTYFLTLLVKTFPVAKDKGALGVLLCLQGCTRLVRVVHQEG